MGWNFIDIIASFYLQGIITFLHWQFDNQFVQRNHLFKFINYIFKFIYE